jgi:hypothetical protein
MNTQPEALRLADWCDQNSSGDYRPSAEAAAELRRIHKANQSMLSALQSIARPTTANFVGMAQIVALAAIAKATGEQQ